MKKLYTKKGPTSRVHPTFNPLSALPTALLALASALSPGDQEVLAYLLGSHQKQQQQQQQHNKQQQQQQQQKNHKNKNPNQNQNHPPDLGCSCFGCYMTFWARWDASPNRHVIHLIIDAFEETLESKSKDAAKGKRTRKKRSSKKPIDDDDDDEIVVEEMDAHEKNDDAHDGGYDEDEDEDGEMEEGKSSVRRFVSWVFGISN